MIGIFFSVPIIVYGELQTADQDKQRLLRQSLEQQGRIIANAIRPSLQNFDGGAAKEIQETLIRVADGGPNVKLLFRPEGGVGDGGFYYIAAAPSLPEDYLAADKEDLRNNGVLARLGQSCAGDRPFAIRYENPRGEEEILTSVNPIRTPSGCWALVTSHSASELLGSVLARPYWQTPEVKVAAIIYTMNAILVIVLFLAIWRSIRRFATQARVIRLNALARHRSFREINEVPELDGVADEFDRMVDGLQGSAQAIRHAAEDNAHAFKTPLAIISQSLEPLKRSTVNADPRARRAIELIERAVQRLDALVSASRRMDEATADMLESASERINFSLLVNEMLDGYAESFAASNITLDRRIEQRIVVEGGVEPLETVLENLLDNAIDFSPSGSKITVELRRVERRVRLRISDEGPGVPEEQLEHVFARYVSDRTAQIQNRGLAHSGIGLWLVRRHVEALGGQVLAQNGGTGGFSVVIELPLHG